MAASKQPGPETRAWLNHPVTIRASREFTEQLEAARVALHSAALSSSDPKVAAAAAKVAQLKVAVRYFGGSIEESEE